MENNINFEKQLAAIAGYYNRIKNLRERQKDDGIMIRIFLKEIIPMYYILRKRVEDDTILPENIKLKLLSIIDSEIKKAPLREAEIERFENENLATYTQKYEGDMAENKKSERPFAIMTEYYNKIISLRERQKDDGIMGRMYLAEIIPIYESMKKRLQADEGLTEGIKAEILAFIEKEMREAPRREEEIIQSEREYADEYAKAYNAALARYNALSPLLRFKYADQFKRLKDDFTFKSIKDLKSFFMDGKAKPTETKGVVSHDDDDDGHDEHQ